MAVLLIGTQTLSINTARTYFSRQLQAHSEATASMLATAYSRDAVPSVDSRRELAADIFKRGDYALIQVDGATPFALRKQTGNGAEVPAWFASLMSAGAASSTQPFASTDGTAGTVTVVADGAQAWSSLWRNCLGLALLIIVAGLCWIAYAVLQVRWLEKRLLHELSVQVRALARGKADPAALPPIRELAGVADALAAAHDHFRVAAEENTARIELLQLELNLDAVTRLPNRKYFFNELRRALKTPPPEGGRPGGHVLMFRQRDLAEINRHMPRDFTDQWLRSIAHRLDQKIGRQHVPALLLARLNGSDFALLLAGMTAAQCSTLAQQLREELRALRVTLGGGRWCRWALALGEYTADDHATEVLARLDHALMRAESEETDAVFRAEPIGAPERGGEHQWRDTLVTALEQHRFSLNIQALQASGGTVLRDEAILMLHDADAPTPVAAEVFMPAAVRLGISAECDIQSVRLGLDWLVSRSGQLAVRVTLASLNQSNFLNRLGQMLRDRPAQAGRLLLEIEAQGLVENYANVRSLCEVATDAGARIGIRQLAQDFGAMTRLHQLPIAYLKFEAEFVASIVHSPGSRQLATSVLETARVLNMEVYAENAADAETEAVLRQIGIIPIRSATAQPVAI
jgi:predicted signal transduction protein with EAL and GGDEF domain